MRKRFLILCLLLCLCLFFAGCFSPIEKPNITDARIFDAPFDDVWNATVKTFAERSLPVTSLEKDSGFITTSSHVIDTSIFGEKTLEDIAVHPNIMFGIWENPKYSVNALVTSEEPNNTRVKINTHIEAYERNVWGRWYICYSNGKIEKSLLRSIESKIR